MNLCHNDAYKINPVRFNKIFKLFDHTFIRDNLMREKSYQLLIYKIYLLINKLQTLQFKN